ncbi:hypothetical protein [Georgenia yuyongxinii]|uniref:Uncharacterized protein n=1 Tax=Georgenia yuyongxinii TaxID=2589797 RepID=A0A552WQP8_9MICO|nr:hypothetical protein [Georgenia yuyongxinii]TRW45044.1 hypothetical protein FJ693_11075 [Georgenia yuyongxinii]
MPKKKRKPRKTASQHRRHAGGARAHRSTAPEALLREFEEWAYANDLLVKDSTWLVGAAIDLKRDWLGSADPTAWSGADIRAVLTELFPTRVVLEPGDGQLLTPTITLYLTFLLQTERLRTDLSEPQLTALMEALAAEVPRALAAPSGRSMGGNIMAYAVEQGVDVSDPAAIAAFMQHYNSLPRADRVAISDGAADGAPAGPPRPTRALAQIWPKALGPLPDPAALERGPFDLVKTAAWMEQSLLLTRARVIAEHVGAGLPVTSTGALRRADTAALMERLGLHRELEPQSMWDVTELTVVWLALARLGYLDIGKTRVRPGEESLPPAGASAQDVVTAGAAVHAAVLHALVQARTDHASDGAEPALVWGALLRAADPAGVAVVAPSPLDDKLAWDLDARRLYYLAHDLGTLSEVGVLERKGNTFRLPRELFPIVPAAMSMVDDD